MQCFAAPVIILTACGSIEMAVESMRLGAHDFVAKPVDLLQLTQTMRNVIAHHRLNQRACAVAGEAEREPGGRPMVSVSRQMQTLRALIAEAAPSNASVLILGESGTGKELVAHSLHQQSRFNDGPFVPVNMAALPATLAEAMLFGHVKGSFTGADSSRCGWCEQAAGGTLFLDEIGEMDIALQAKLLRFLQERRLQPVGSTTTKSIVVRVIAATNRDPLALIREGRLREDLYYRLNVIPIEVPPLRARRDDIPLLAMYFLRRAAAEHAKPATSITPEVLTILQSYDWPGNVRQLENLIQRLVILAPRNQITLKLLPAEILNGSTPAAEPLRPETLIADGMTIINRLEKQAILDALENARGNIVRTGQLLGMSQATIYRKIKRYDISLTRRRSSNTSPG